MLDTVTHAEKGIKSIYIIDDQERVIGIGLPKEGRPLRDDQIGIDFRDAASSAPRVSGKARSGRTLACRRVETSSWPGQASDSSRQ